MALRIPREYNHLSKKEIKKKALSQAQSVIDNLKKAYEARPKDLPHEEEKKLLHLMDHAKKLKKELEKMFSARGGKEKT